MNKIYRFDLDDNEKILKKGHASLTIEDATLSGALYLTNKRLVFVGHMLGGSASKKELSLFLGQVASITGGKTALIVPNAIDVVTEAGDQLRFVLRNRNEWLSEIRNKMAAADKSRDSE